jgi:hypothetical protein
MGYIWDISMGYQWDIGYQLDIYGIFQWDINGVSTGTGSVAKQGYETTPEISVDACLQVADFSVTHGGNATRAAASGVYCPPAVLANSFSEE